MSMLKDGAKYEVCFVKRRESCRGKEAMDPLVLAFEAMDSNALEPVWVEEDDVLRITRKEAKLFVVDPFEGPSFDHLRSVQCRVVGPLTILSCLRSGDVLPKRPCPVFSVAMRRMTVSVSNIENALREDIARKVVLMGGLFSKDLTRSVTHLVVGEVGSKKYQVAANFGLKIMVPEWIEEVWNNGQHCQVHANDPIYDKFKCPVFKGLVITVSQLTAEERAVVQTLVAENGGTYLAPLKAHKTTHLVLHEPTGDKYRFAKTWKVFCVSLMWIYESIKSGYCKDENLFKVDDSTLKKQAEPKRSTPNKDLTSLDLPAIDCSVITNSSVVTHLDETTTSEASFAKRPSDPLDALDSFDLSSLPRSGQFLDGCKIFLSGFEARRLDKLRRIVNAGGGIRFSKFTDSISHVVCGGGVSAELRRTLAGSPRPPLVVRADWLLESCRRGAPADEKPFLCVDVTPLSPEKEEEEEEASQRKPRVEVTVEEQEDVTSIFNQYVVGQNGVDDKDGRSTNGGGERPAQNGVGNQDVSRDIRRSPNVADIPDLKEEIEAVKPPDQDVCQAFERFVSAEGEGQPPAEDPPDGEGSEQLFAGLSFSIVGFGDRDQQALVEMIEAHSGAVAVGETADVAVVPLTWEGEPPPAVRVVATSCWLQTCIEECRLHDFDENELFRPLRVAAPADLLRGLVLSISQYKGTERDSIAHLCELMGGVAQDFFVRKANRDRGVLSNTHLVAELPEGNRYEAAKKWGVPVVGKQWVLDAAKTGTLPPVEPYLVKPPRPRVPVINLDSTPKVSTPRTAVKKADESRLREGGISPVLARGPEVSLNETTGTLNLDQSIKMKFQVSDLLKDLDSTSSPQQNNRSAANNASMQLDEVFGRNLASALKKVRKGGVGGDESSFFEPHHHQGEPPLKGVGVCVARKLSHMQSELRDIVCELGGEFFYDPAGCTHFVFVGKTNDLTKEFREALANGKVVVCPDWLFACQERHERVDEALYPHTMRANRSLVEDIAIVRTSSQVARGQDDHSPGTSGGACNGKDDPQPENSRTNRKRQGDTETTTIAEKTPNRKRPDDSQTDVSKADTNIRKRESDPEPEILMVKTTTTDGRASNVTNRKRPDGSQTDISKTVDKTPEGQDDPHLDPPSKVEERRSRRSSSQKAPLADFKQLNHLLEAAKSAKRRQSRRVLESVSSTPVAAESPLQHLRQRLSFTEGADDDNGEEGESQQSQSCPVVWDDPTGRREREKIAAAMAANASPFRNSIGSPMQQVATPVAEKKKFMFTSIPDSQREEMEEAILALGGEVSEEKAFDPSATHLLMQKPLKNEKFLSSVAAGKWVLRPDYVAACREAAAFLPEEDFEWGQGTNGNNKLHACPRRWRERLADGHQGAFADWRVAVLADDPAKRATYVKVLEAGGATVVSESEPDVGFAMVDARKRGSTIDVTPLVARGVKCVRPEYLAFYLMEDPPPELDAYLVAEPEPPPAPSAGKRRNLSIATRGSKRTRFSQASE